MEQLIIIKTNNPKIKIFLDQEKQNYKVFNQTQRKKDLFNKLMGFIRNPWLFGVFAGGAWVVLGIKNWVDSIKVKPRQE